MTIAAAVLLLLAQESSDVVDRHIKATWDSAGLSPTRMSSDEVFLRRVSLDLTGVIPTASEVDQFLRESSSSKRQKKVDELLASSAYAKYWGQLWTVALVGWFNEGENYSREELRDWLGEQFAKDAPWNRIALALLAAQGSTVSNRAANFAVRYLSESPEAFTTRVTKTFLGIRLNCAQCHDHPFDVWTREDFYGLASFFSRSQVVQAGKAGAEANALSDAVVGDGLQPEGFKAAVSPRFLYGAKPVTNLWRQEAALYITRSPQFARAFVNRTWTQLMGRGIVHPPENFSKKNKPSHPQLLEELTKDFVAHGYGIKWLVRTIVSSKAYQLASENVGFKPEQDRYFAYAITKPLNPWQVWSSMIRATGLELDYGSEEARLSADRQAFIAQFTDSLDSDTTASHVYNETSGNLLAKFSKDYLADSGASEPHTLLTRIRKAPQKTRVDVVYRSVLGRSPSPEERVRAQKYLDSTTPEDDPGQGVRDLFYALINSHEFNFNH